jgi:hypothetical protein
VRRPRLGPRRGGLRWHDVAPGRPSRVASAVSVSGRGGLRLALRAIWISSATGVAGRARRRRLSPLRRAAPGPTSPP